MKKIIKALAIVFIIFTLNFTLAFASSNGWYKEGNNWYYINANGNYHVGWKHDGNAWYYLNNDGKMATGWKYVGNTWYYLNSNGSMAIGWKYVGNAWYYLNSNGSMATGWKYVGNAWYYLNSNGSMATGWKYVGNAWYYLNSNGSMATGWKYVGNTWYYLNSNGSMATGWKYVGNTWYYLNSNGSMATGWINTSSNSKYYLLANGKMAVGRFKDEKTGDIYFANKSGVILTKQIYLDEETGSKYYLNDEGKIKIGKFVDETSGNTVLTDEEGRIIKYIPKEEKPKEDNSNKNIKITDSKKVKNKWIYNKNKWYYIDENGNKKIGWHYDSYYKARYYFDENGVMKTGWIKDKETGDWYYLKKSGAMATGWIKPASVWYYLNEDGSMRIGWLYDNWYKAWFYFDKSGAMVTGEHFIDNEKQVFDSSGKLIEDDNFRTENPKDKYTEVPKSQTKKTEPRRKRVTKNFNPMKQDVNKFKKIADYHINNEDDKKNMKYIIDISEHNGYIDFEKLKDNVDGVILRIGWGYFTYDKRFEENLEQLKKHKIPFGIYFYSYALNLNEVEEEADHVIAALRKHNVKPDFPVYFDIEDADGYKVRKGVPFYRNRRLYTEMIEAFCDKIAEAGYEPGVYASKSWFDQFTNDLSNYHLWLAHWGVPKPTMDFVGLWQYTDHGNGHKIGLTSANVDENYAYFAPRKN